MNDYFGGQSIADLEALLRRLIDQGTEGHKVDFKEALAIGTKEEKAEFAKDVSSIANTDDEAHLDDCGFIIFGARRGKLIGGIAELGGDADKLQAQVTDLLKGFLSPVPSFSLVAFVDPAVGPWGGIVIPPSVRQPHLIIRDGVGVVKHEWWVRINDTKERAGALDYSRVLTKAVRREVRPLEQEQQRLALLVEQRSHSADLGTIVAAIRGEAVGTVATSSSSDLAGAIRGLLVRGPTAIEDQLVAEGLRLAEVMGGESAQNPWAFDGMKPEQLRDVLTYLEEQTFPLAEALATVARYDRETSLSDVVCRTLRVMAREPRPTGTHYRYAAQFRLYPLVLCLYAIAIVGVNEARADLLSRIFGLSLEREERDGTDPIVVAIRRMRSTSDLLRYALENEYFEPLAVRVRERLLPRLAPLLAGTPAKDAFYVAEFVLALAFLKVSETQFHGKLPLPGTYLYEWGARRPIRAFLEGRPDWLEKALGMSPESLLADFDSTVKDAVSRHSVGSRDGVVGGVMDAYRPNPNNS